MAESGRIVPRA